ncbi:MAG: metal-dependent hydrolase [Microvirga sp.]|nr:metal-dependent hydrolase [Microvirga sp.]
MDTLTQILLGAAVGGAVGAPRLGWIAPAAGAVGGLIPDLDVFWPTRPGSVDFWDVHRGVTHSLFFGPVVGSALAWICARVHAARLRRRGEEARGLYASWALVWILSIFTHPLLDLFTVYGTQLLAPFSARRFALPAVPIIDPVYTLMLVAALLVAWRAGWRDAGARKALVAGLVLSTAYLGLGLTQHHRALALARAEGSPQIREASVVAASTTMFTPWLRRVTLEGATARHVGFVSTLNPQPITWIAIERDPAAEALAATALATPEGARYRRFASSVVHPHIVADEGGRRWLRLGDMRYGAPGESITGQWGLAWPLDEADGIAGEGLRYGVSPGATWERVVALLRASVGLENPVF